MKNKLYVALFAALATLGMLSIGSPAMAGIECVGNGHQCAQSNDGTLYQQSCSQPELEQAN